MLGGAERASRQAAAERFAWAGALLRCDREDRRRPDKSKSGNQRTLEGVRRRGRPSTAKALR